jgi:PrgI family protein
MSRDRVRLPANVEMEDQIAFGLTARQIAILAAAAILSYLVYIAASAVLPVVVAVVLTAPLGILGAALALARHAGLTGDQLALAAARHLSAPRRRVLAPDGLSAPMRGAPTQPRTSALDLPVRAVARSGVVELAEGQHCLLLAASGPAFELRSEEEQAALVEAFGRWLNGLAEPVSIYIQGQPAELDRHAQRLTATAGKLPHPALARAARAHAGFLEQLVAGEGVRRREIILVLATRTRDRAAAETALRGRAREASELLRSCAVECRELPGEHAAAVLARAVTPAGPVAGSHLTGTVRAC